MALESNAFTTFSAIGNREDLVNAIYKISPMETPFFSGAKKVKATATKHEWQTDVLADAAINAQLEGDVFTADAATATVRLSNNTQISRKVPRVTRTQIAVQSAGRPNEMAYQFTKNGQELKRDIEKGLLANQAAATGNATTPRKLAAVISWLATNVDKASDGTNPTGDGSDTRGDGTARAFTEAQLKSVLKQCYDQGGKPKTIMVGSFNKQQFSTFTGRASPIEETTSKTIVASVTAYDSDFGELKVVPNLFMRTSDALVLQMDMWAVANLREMETYDLAITGDTIAKALIQEYTLESRNQKSSGIVADLTAS